MAYHNTYTFEFKSNAGLAYRLEFWDQGSGASSFSGTEGTLGPNAAKISYASSDKTMFASIKASTLEIEFMVTDNIGGAYVNQLRNNRQERDVYVYLYLTGPNHFSGSIPSNYRPIFAGYLLMDLAEDPDVAVPFVQKLKAVDGLASLKYYDFVPPTTAQRADSLYPKEETWIPDADNSGGIYPTFRTMIEWLQKILYYTGYPTTTKGCANESKIYTACNWFNGQMSSTSIDPLYNTRSQCASFYSTNGDSGEIKYKPITAYKALQSICKSFGLRCIMYRNNFYFISVSNYETNNSGTLATPINIPYHSYEMDGFSGIGSGTNLDYYWGRYYVPISNTLASATVNRKLAGTKFGLLPALKKVVVDYMNLNDYNYFSTFPLLPDPYPTCPTTSYAEYANLGIFEFDGVNSELYYQEVWLDFINNSPDGEIEIETRFTLVAREVGSTGAWLQWGLAGTSTPQWWAYGGGLGIGYIGSEFSNIITLPVGASTHNIAGPSGGSMGGGFGTMRSFVEFPTSAFPAGQYEVKYKIGASWICPSGNWIEGHGGCMSVISPNSSTMTPDANLVTYGNTTLTAGYGSSIFAKVESGAIGSNSTNTQVVQAGADTAVLEIKDIKFGDSPGSVSGLEVYNGSAWVNSGFAGFWGAGTLTGSASLSETLCNEVLKRQMKNVRKTDMKIAMTLDYREHDGSGNRPIYPMPLSRFYTPSHGPSGTTSANWILNTGTFNVVKDEWRLNLYEFATFALTGTTATTTNNYSGNAGNTGDPGQAPTAGGQSAKIGNWNTPTPIEIKQLNNTTPNPVALITANQLIDDLTTTSQTITSLSVLPMPDALLKDGDTILLQSAKNAPRSEDNGVGTLEFGNITFTVAADQLADATSISVDSKTVYQNIYKGDLICISQPDLISQYQNKTKGTIAGMDVTADSIDGAKQIGRNQIFFRVEGQNLTDGNYYVLNGEDNNKSGRFSPTNTNAPSTIGTQKGFKAMKLIADRDLTLESGTFIGSGSTGWNIQLILYKTTPVDGSAATTAMTQLGVYNIALGGDSITQVDNLTIDTSSISRGDIIVPHLYAAEEGDDSTFDFRGGIVFTLART